MAVPHSDDGGKRRTALKIKNSLQKEMDILKLDDMSGSEAEEIDISKEIHPLGYFINDREQMVEEMFSIIKEENLQKMLPPSLKSYTVEELKADCLVHLLGMSRKRIFAILEGRDLNSSSDSESEESHSESDSAEEPQITSSTHVRSNSEEGDTLDISVSKDDLKILTSDKNNQSLKRKIPRVKEEKCNKSSKIVSESTQICSIVISDDEVDTKKPKKKKNGRTVLKLKKETDELKREEKVNEKKIKKLKKGKNKSGSLVKDESKNKEVNLTERNSDEESDYKKGKSLLEILELEMRARAIRALLKNTPNADEPVPVSILNMKPEPAIKLEKNSDINKTIADVINDKLEEKESSDTCDASDDVEISEVCDVDLTVTIDDDDDDEILQPATSSAKSTAEESSKTIATKAAEKTSESADSLSAKEICNNTKETRIENTVIADETLPSSKNEPDSTGEHSKSTTASKEDVSWSQRWMESKGVKEVMKNTKLCANIRKRMRFVRMLKQKKLQESNAAVSATVDLDGVEESSVAQYNLIKSLDKSKAVAEKTNENSLVPIIDVPEAEKGSIGEHAIVTMEEKTRDSHDVDSNGEIVLEMDSTNVLNRLNILE